MPIETTDLDARMKETAVLRDRLLDVLRYTRDGKIRVSALISILMETASAEGIIVDLPEMIEQAVDAVMTAMCGCDDCKKRMAARTVGSTPAAERS